MRKNAGSGSGSALNQCGYETLPAIVDFPTIAGIHDVASFVPDILAVAGVTTVLFCTVP
jgi:hypothetical protein